MRGLRTSFANPTGPPRFHNQHNVTPATVTSGLALGCFISFHCGGYRPFCVMGPFGILPNLLKSVLEQHRQCSGVPIIVVDIHSHILPEVDDGPKSWDVCVAMCRAAAAGGITHIVPTTHANDPSPYDREFLQGLVAHLQQLAGDAPQIPLGCDFHLSYENI